MANKPNCYDCKYRGNLPGDAHSCCLHPDSGIKDGNVILALINLVAGNREGIKKLGITASPHGVQSGWFYWPANFDPVWLESCNGFEEKAK